MVDRCGKHREPSSRFAPRRHAAKREVRRERSRLSAILRRTLVIGSSGQLGSEIVKSLSGLDVIGVDHAFVDIERSAEVASAVAHVRPSLVVNTAAYHNVERCETHAERAFAVNTVAVDALATICEASNAALAHISTDYVFDGNTSTPYDESANAHPLNVYGISKYAGELAVRARTKRAFIFRVSGLYGISGRSAKGETFVERIRRQARAGETLRVVDDLTSSPSYAADVASSIRSILEVGEFGTYHVTNSGGCTWYEFACEILAASNLDAPIERTTSEAFASYVTRPHYTVLAHGGISRIGVPAPPDWRDGLRRYLLARGATA
jgi:dTDP-4-dehydrorhamnose reductase